jgi:hypothetical protein
MTDEPYEVSYYEFSGVVENGYVDITKKKTVIYFPALTQALSGAPKDLNLYLNAKLILSFNWLPFFSPTDFWIIMDMFLKCSYSLEPHYIPYTASPYRAFNKLVTNINVNQFSIYTLEEINNTRVNTSIQITSQPEINPSPLPLTDSVFEIFIGPSLVFCSERDLAGLNREDTMYIIQFILHKFTEF